MGGLFGGGGGATTNKQPQAGAGSTSQIYQPQNQPALDQSFQTLLTNLYNPALGGLQAAGGITPAQTIYPQAANIGGSLSSLSDPTYGGYGPYAGNAIRAALDAQGGLASLQGSGQGPLGYGTQVGQAASGLLPSIAGLGQNPAYAGAVSEIQYNPYFGQAMQGAQSGANIGGNVAADAFGQEVGLGHLAATLPGAGQAASAQTQQQIPLLQQLAALSGGQAPGALGQAQALSPQLQDLFKQLVPGLAGAAPQYATAAGATNPQLQQIGASGQSLVGAAPGLANQALTGSAGVLGNVNQAGQGLISLAPGIASGLANVSPNMLQQINQAGKGLMNAAPGYAGLELGLNAPLAGAESSILQSGMDPRGALYNRTQQQVTDQQNAVNSLSGVGTSPYGAGVTGQAQQNFNIDWQNQQLQRQIAAGQAASGLSGQQASNIQGAGSLLSGLTGAGAGLGLGVAGERLAQGQAGAKALSDLTTAGGNLQLGGASQQLANTQGGANILNQLIQGGGGLGLSAASGQLANTIGGGNLLNALSQGAGGLGSELTTGQLNNLTGGANAFNQFAQGAGNLANTAAGLSSSGLGQLLSAYGGAGSLSGEGFNLGAGASQLAGASAAAPANLQNQQYAKVLEALLSQGTGALQGVQGLGSLGNTLQNAGTGQLQGLQAGAQLGALPYQTSATTGQNALNALTQQMNLGNAQYQLPQQVLGDLESYLNLGQTAALYGGQLGALGAQGQQSQLSNIGTLGSLAMPGLFGSPGLGLSSGSGILGSGTQGLLGSGGLGGSLGGGLLGSFPSQSIDAATGDFSAGAGSGLLGWLGGLIQSAGPAAAAFAAA
jgi:hypothetical protein